MSGSAVTSQRVVLHVGAMKSGTSYLQSLLFANKELLLQRGVLLPGPRWAFQVRAVRSLMTGEGDEWERLGAEVGNHPGTSVVSMEFLGPLRPQVARSAVERLPVDDVRVVVTARDLNRSIAAMWQETVQNGRTWTWDEYVEAVTAWRPSHRRARRATEAGRTFWRQQNIGRIVSAWADVVGPDRVTLVTVPHPGAPRDLLWQRFAEVLETDADGLEPARAANESIGTASTLALRRLNELLEARGLQGQDGAPLRKGVLAKQVLAARKDQEPVTGLPVASWVEKESRRMRRALADSGVRVVGDLDDLAPVEVPGVHPSEIDEHEVTEAALSALAWAVQELVGDAVADQPDQPDQPDQTGRPGPAGHDVGRGA